jgi:hypothetical protein
MRSYTSLDSAPLISWSARIALAHRAEMHRFFAPRLDGVATVRVMSGAGLRMTGAWGVGSGCSWLHNGTPRFQGPSRFCYWRGGVPGGRKCGGSCLPSALGEAPGRGEMSASPIGAVQRAIAKIPVISHTARQSNVAAAGTPKMRTLVDTIALDRLSAVSRNQGCCFRFRTPDGGFARKCLFS